MKTLIHDIDNIPGTLYNEIMRGGEPFMGKVYGYVRVSTETQAEKGGGLEVQKSSLAKYAKDHDITIERIFEDAGISGTDESRPALDELLSEYLREGDTILVHTTSRLWRNIFAQATIMKSVMNAKANIRSIDEPSFDVYKYMTDPENFMISGMMGMLDQWERMTIARKLARGRTSKAQGGTKPAGNCPFGYQYSEDKKSVLIDEAEARVVKMIFTEGQKGKSLHQIADYLNSQGLTTRRGKTWSAGSVQVVLKNRFYIGELQHQGKTIKGNQKPIISAVQFGKCQSQLKQRKKG